MWTDRVLTVPNAISVGRLLGVPIFLYLFLVERADLAAVAVLAVGGTTDWIDGYLARRLGQESRLGELLDPLADRLYILATLVAFTVRDIVPWQFAAALLARDAILLACLAALRRYRYGPPPVHYMGKTATFILLLAFPMLLLADALRSAQAAPAAVDLSYASGWALAWWGLGLYWFAGVLYLRQMVGLARAARRATAGNPGTPLGVPAKFSRDLLTELIEDPLDPAYAAAAKRRAVRGPEPAWVRASSRTASLLTVAVVGFLLAVAYQHVVAAQPESSRTRAGLVDEVRQRQQTTDELSRHAERLRDEVDRQREAALASDEVTRLRNLAAAAGLGRVRGDGVVIEVRDAPAAPDGVTGDTGTENLGRVLDRDLQAIVNALWDAGAEAVAINGQRLSGTATIRAAGAAILVDFKPVTSPYQVAAIGPADLGRRFDRSSTGALFRQLAREYKMSVKIRQQDDLRLPSATDPQLRYARPPRPRSAPSAPPPVSPSTAGVPEPSASGGR